MRVTKHTSVPISNKDLQDIIEDYKAMGNSLIPLISAISQLSQVSSKLSRMAIDLEAYCRSLQNTHRRDHFEAITEISESIKRNLCKELQPLITSLPAMHGTSVALLKSMSETLETTRYNIESVKSLSKPKRKQSPNERETFEAQDSSSVEVDFIDPLDEILSGDL